MGATKLQAAWINIAPFIILIILLHQECYGSFILDAAEKIYPNSTIREKNLIASLNTLKNMRIEAAQLGSRNNMQKKIEASTVLCVTFVEPSFKHMAVAEYNMKVSARHCDWGVLHVGEDKYNVMGALERSSVVNNVTLQFVDKAYTADEALRKFVSRQSEYDAILNALGNKFESIGVPKSFLLMQIIPYARKYNYVWLLDSDITFEKFQIDEYFNTMRGLPQSPLLLQPVVGTNDRPHTKLNQNYYAKRSVPGHIAPSNIIEIMLPMIDSAFLVWFANFFIKPMMGVAYAVSGDFGSDLIWCRASALYLEIGLDVKDYKARANAACIVITHTPIQHLDWDELPKNSKSDAGRLSEMYVHLLDGVKELRARFLSGSVAKKIDENKLIAEKIKERRDTRSKQEKWRDEHPDHPASIAYAKKQAEKAAKIAAVEATEAEEEEINEQNKEVVTTSDLLRAAGVNGVELGKNGDISAAPIKQVVADLPLNPDHHALPSWMAGKNIGILDH